MQNPEIKTAVLFADSARGIYIPQHFAETAERSKFTGIDAEQWSILEDPDHEHYWLVWDEVLNNAETTCGGVLHQDGDLWIVWPEQAIDSINAYTEQCVECEEKHGDAGDGFAYLVSEAWCERTTSELIESLNEEKRDASVKDHFAADSYKPHWQLLGIDSRWKTIDPDTLADMVCDGLFDMQPGHMFGPYDGGIVLAGFPLQEIEIDLEPLGIDGVTLDFIRESCEPYISGSCAYVSTDAAWFAVLDVESFNTAIANHFIN